MPFRIIKPELSSFGATSSPTLRIDPPARRRVGRPLSPSPAIDVESADGRAANRDANGDYIVGKGRPPAEHQFRKGKSGNPKGRPVNAKGVNTLVREVFGPRQPVRTPQGERQMNTPEIALIKMRELAAKGELPAIVAVLRHWTQAVPDLPQKSAASTPAILSPAEQQIIDMLINSFGIVDDRIMQPGQGD